MLANEKQTEKYKLFQKEEGEEEIYRYHVTNFDSKAFD